jgi:hypothetical protein
VALTDTPISKLKELIVSGELAPGARAMLMHVSGVENWLRPAS